MNLNDIVKEAEKSIDSLKGLDSLFNVAPDLLMSQFSESEKSQINKMVGDFDKTNLTDIENKIKEIKEEIKKEEDAS